MDGSEAPIELDAGWRDEPLKADRFLAMVRRNLLVLILGPGAGILFGLAYIVLAQPIYRATATIQIDIHGIASTDALTVMQLDNHVERVRSDEVTKAVIDKLGLDEVFDAGLGRLDRSVQAARDWLGLDEAGDDTGTDAESAELIPVVGSALEVERIGNTAMIAISYLSTTRALAVEIANAYANTYLEQAQAASVDSETRRVRRLQDRMADVRQQADAAEETVRRLRFQGGVSVSDPLDLGRQIADLKQGLGEADLEAEATRIKLDAISSVKDVAKLPPGAMQTERIAGLHGDLVVSERQLEALRARTASVAVIRQVEGVVAGLRDSLQQELQQLSDTLELQLATAIAARSRRAAELDTLMEYGKSAAWSQLQDVEREAQLYRAMSDDYSKDLETAYLQSSVQSGVSLQSAALPPIRPSFPRYKVVLALSMVLGLLLGLGVAMYREWNR